MNVIVDVTPEDIKNGKKSDVRSCPIARALQRQVPNSEHVTVGIYNATVEIKEKRSWNNLFKTKYTFVTAEIPQDAREFIARFDVGQPVQPSQFNLKFKEWA